MNDFEREKWNKQREELAQAAGIILHVLTTLPATSKAFDELLHAVEHIDAASKDTPEYGRDPSLRALKGEALTEEQKALILMMGGKKECVITHADAFDITSRLLDLGLIHKAGANEYDLTEKGRAVYRVLRDAKRLGYE